MSKVSCIIAARNETFLYQTVEDLLHNAVDDIEVLVGFDGSPYIELPHDPRVFPFYYSQEGLKPTINKLAAQTRGQYILKCDAHCAFSPGYDDVLASTMEPNWMVVPRFYTLNAEEWKWQSDRHCDYWHLDCPLTDRKGYRFRAGGYWWDRTKARADIGPLDETLTHHGSCWFVGRDFFLNKLGGMQSEGYGVNWMEPADLGLRTWLGPWDGRVMVNKGCWYAHAHKGSQRPRGYPMSMQDINRSYLWTANHWMRNRWPQAVHKLEWLIDRFWPVPTWPENWRELQAKYEQEHPE